MEKGTIIKHDLKKAPKTGDWAYMLPVVDKEKCIGCGTCTDFCPEAAIVVSSISIKYSVSSIKNKKIAKVDYHFCKGCGVCTTVCPVKAIIMKKK